MALEVTPRQLEVLQIVASGQSASISTIHEQLSDAVSIPTLNRDVAALVELGYLHKTGKGRATAYVVTPYYQLFAPIDIEAYFARDPDQRNVASGFNHTLSHLLERASLFSRKEQAHLKALKEEYQANISTISPAIYQKELERLTIELSWKSSQIEGNTYSLLETERLFTEQQAAEGKTQEEATMLLNHKHCLDYILSHPDMGKTLNVKMLEELHSLLIADLGVSPNLRSRVVGITGTAYKPLDNVYQIKEAIEAMCHIINKRKNGFEKALLAVVLISYIQPFEDGNKRTGRMVSNALLIAEGACPLSFRSVDSLEYKKAMLLFYEQNNLSAFKELFLHQVEFAVKNYFR
jgi:Fic family protein